MPETKITLRIRKHRSIATIPYLLNENEDKYFNYNQYQTLTQCKLRICI